MSEEDKKTESSDSQPESEQKPDQKPEPFVPSTTDPGKDTNTFTQDQIEKKNI